MYVLNEYDKALEQILKKGKKKKNRTGVDTLSIFGIQSRYPISTHFPILTRRKVWPRSIFAELIWFLSGSTNVRDLQALGSRIWDKWEDTKFEQEHNYDPGDLGPVYGFQLRRFGDKYLEYEKCDSGFDQLQYMVKTLKEDPNSRRNLFTLWNPNDLHLQRLPCCHVMFQVEAYEGKLSGLLTQRSCDFPVGVPANIQFYAALLYLLAQQTELTPHELVHSTADSHIYVNQIEAVEAYLNRPKPDSPQLSVVKQEDIISYRPEHFILKSYNPLEPIKMEVTI